MEKGVLVVLTRFFQPIPIIPPVRLFESSMNLIRGVAALLSPRSLASSFFLISATRARGSTLDVVNREEIELLHALVWCPQAGHCALSALLSLCRYPFTGKWPILIWYIASLHPYCHYCS